MINSNLAPAGTIGLAVTRKDSQTATPGRVLSFFEVVKHGFPRPGLPAGVAAWRFRNLPNLFRGLFRITLAKLMRIPHFYGQVSLVKIINGRAVDLGLASLRVVTTAGVGYIVDSFQGTVEPENMRYHGFGTGTTAEAVGDTALVTELTTQYAADNTRPTGSQTEGASANIFRTVATLAPDTGGTIAITEHGIFSQAATGGGVLLDRSVFSAVNLVAGSDTLQVTYDLTFTAGS